MAVSDYKNGTVVATVPIGQGVDGAAMTPKFTTRTRQTPMEH